MELSLNLLTAIVILGLTHFVPAQKLLSLNMAHLDLHESDWEKQLETGIVALEANCNENDIPFNREKVTMDLRNCLHPIVTQEAMTHLDPFQKSLSHDELFRQLYIEPVCSKVSQSMACLKPHKKIIENCAREDGKAMQELLKSACKRNGTKIVEFIKEGGFDCITSRADEFSGCFKHKNATEVLQSSNDVCSYFQTVRDCAISVFFKCDKKIPGKIIKSIFEEVDLETGGRCLGEIRDFVQADEPTKEDHSASAKGSGPGSGSVSAASSASVTMYFTFITIISLFLVFRT
jgi:hypothetical protein